MFVPWQIELPTHPTHEAFTQFSNKQLTLGTVRSEYVQPINTLTGAEFGKTLNIIEHILLLAFCTI